MVLWWFAFKRSIFLTVTCVLFTEGPWLYCRHWLQGSALWGVQDIRVPNALDSICIHSCLRQLWEQLMFVGDQDCFPRQTACFVELSEVEDFWVLDHFFNKSWFLYARNAPVVTHHGNFLCNFFCLHSFGPFPNFRCAICLWYAPSGTCTHMQLLSFACLSVPGQRLSCKKCLWRLAIKVLCAGFFSMSHESQMSAVSVSLLR